MILELKYVNQDDVDHLLQIIKEKYPVKVKMNPEQYIGINMKWNYTKRTLTCSMNGYVENALKVFKHAFPKQNYLAPKRYDAPKFGAKVQCAHNDDTPPLNADQIKFIQRVTGKFLFYAQAIDNTMLLALN
jgi:hypothetical protein